MQFLCLNKIESSTLEWVVDHKEKRDLRVSEDAIRGIWTPVDGAKTSKVQLARMDAKPVRTELTPFLLFKLLVLAVWSYGRISGG